MPTPEQQPLSDFAAVELRPDRGRAFAWTCLAVVLTTVAVWFLVDLGPTVFSIVFALFTLAPLLYFGVQLVAPDRFVVRLQPDELETHQLWNHQLVPWEHVQRAAVSRAAGEPVLQIDTSEHGGLRTYLLPLGSDLEVVHRFLRARLGVLEPPPAHD